MSKSGKAALHQNALNSVPLVDKALKSGSQAVPLIPPVLGSRRLSGYIPRQHLGREFGAKLGSEPNVRSVFEWVRYRREFFEKTGDLSRDHGRRHARSFKQVSGATSGLESTIRTVATPIGILVSPWADWARRPSGESSGLTRTPDASSTLLDAQRPPELGLLLPRRALRHDTPRSSRGALSSRDWPTRPPRERARTGREPVNQPRSTGQLSHRRQRPSTSP